MALCRAHQEQSLAGWRRDWAEVEASLWASDWAAQASGSASAHYKGRQALLCDQRFGEPAGASQKALSAAAADRRDIQIVEAGIWLGRIKCAQGKSTSSTPTLGIDGDE